MRKVRSCVVGRSALHTALFAGSLVACGSGSAGDPRSGAALPAMTPATLTMHLGTTRQMSVSNLTSDSLVWSSSDSNRARVDQTGLVRAVRLGTALITVAAHGSPSRSATAALTVVFDGSTCCGQIAAISLSSLRDARTAAPLFADSLRDSVAIIASAKEWRLHSELLLLISGRRDTIISQRVPADFIEGALPIGWNTNARAAGQRVFPDGAYRLDLRLVNGADTTRSPNTVPAVVTNP
ncbi:MAG: Ig-like domain-containing protein [bacterium]